MAQITVSIAGRAYRMACGDGEEERLEALARDIDTRVDEMRKSFGEIGDQRLTVMAAIAIADELNEMKKKISALETSVAEMREAQQTAASAQDDISGTLARSLESAAERVERIAKAMR